MKLKCMDNIEIRGLDIENTPKRIYEHKRDLKKDDEKNAMV